MKKFIPITVLIIIAIITWYFDIYEYFSLQNLKENKQYITTFIEKNWLTSISIYIVAYIIVVALSIPAATIMTLIGGFFYGSMLATVLVVFSASIGASIIFLSIKFATQKKDIKTKETNWLKTMQQGFIKNAFFYLLTLRLIPIFPFVLVNIGAGILQIPLRIFFFTTLIGIIPASFIYASIGTSLQTIIDANQLEINLLLEPKIIIAFIALAMLSITPVIYKKIKNKHNEYRKPAS